MNDVKIIKYKKITDIKLKFNKILLNKKIEKQNLGINKKNKTNIKI